MHLTLSDIARRVDGVLAGGAPGGAPVTSAVIDSRSVAPGSLFAALAGERADGHDFAAAAIEGGAVAILASRELTQPCVVVPDVAAALTTLSRSWLAELPDLTVVGLTGSAGKTTTKDLLAALLARRGPTVAPAGNLNNELGVPLTALQAGRDTRYLVVEMGARGGGHIAALCDVVAPRIGLVLNVGSAHLGEFGSPAAIATAKGELVAALPAEGTAVLNADDPAVLAMASRGPAKVLTFGTGAADVRVRAIELDAQGRASFQLSARGAEVAVTLQLVGEHQVSNAAGAAAVALELGLQLEEISDVLGRAVPASRWRMEVSQTPDGVTVINDAYNASPESMRAALKALVAMTRGSSRRAWAVLGEMAELGPDSPEVHHSIGELVVRLNVDRLVVVGERAGRIHAGAVLEGSWEHESVHVADTDAAVDLLRGSVHPGDVVLVKGSRVAGMERVAAALLSGPQSGGPRA